MTTRLARAASADEACRATVTTLGAHTGAMAAILLPVRDHLRVVAATGSWKVFSSIRAGAGVSGRVFRSGHTETLTKPGDDPDYIPFGAEVTLEVCTPVLDPDGRSIGVLNVEWADDVDVESARSAVESSAQCLGIRITTLGGPPAESRSEKLLRHAGALTAASTEWELMAAANDAARDVSGLSAAVLVLNEDPGIRIGMPTVIPGDLESRLRTLLSECPEHILMELIDRAHRFGASYTLGERGHPAARPYAALVEAGASTMISVPVGPADSGGVMLVGDERTLRPDPSTVNLMELLAAQAWACLDRLRSLAKLRERAMSDPLTGLRHQVPFGDRLARAIPGHTALLAIDIDQFKVINDTYGHQEGDLVLVAVARALQAGLRHVDELFRLGGDEFVAVLEVRHTDEAVGIAQRLTEAARAIGRTVSVGVAILDDDEPPETALRRADAALYRVKRDGRDGVRLAA